MPLTNQEQKRYNRHIILHDIRIQGQEKIKETSILVVGAGGLGSPILYYLTAAGVGHIGIMDDDVVSESNLQRQILYDTTHVGTPESHRRHHEIKTTKSIHPDYTIFYPVIAG